MTERLEPQTVVDGRYAIERRIGSGGMADVYLATDLQLGRSVALKLLYRRLAEDPELVERFRREASAAAGLQHQNIVAVYDRGEWDGTYYIAMEYLEGRTLKQLLQERGCLDPDEAIDIATQILRALRFAHRRGVIHRDIKPHNVIVDDDGAATVTDFGIARAGASDMTQTGSIMGTAQYLSPEQAQGHAVSAQSDLYAVGVVLYEMLTGRIPFDGESAVAIALKQVSETPLAPSAHNAAIPPALEQAILRALEKDPAARFADADELIAALEAARGAGSRDGTRTTIVGAPAFAPAPAAAQPPSYGHPLPPSGGYDDDGPGPRWWLFAVGALVVVGVLIASLLLLRGDQVIVPKVVGSELAVAQSTLQREGFSVDSVTRASDRPKGEVTGQSPEGGARAAKGSVVTLTVSDGPGTATVPPVDGLSARDARDLLEQAGLRVRVRAGPSDAVPKGRAIGTRPVDGTQVERGTTVTLEVSSGPEQVAVPSVVGRTEDEARALLTAAGLQVGVTRRDDDKADPGTVLSQDPPAGGKVDRGSTVSLVVARQPAEVPVPDVTGLDEATALERLRADGFAVRERTVDVDSEDRDGIVVDQRPPGGTAKRGSAVRIGIGRFNPPPEPGASGDGSTGGGA